MCWWFAVFLALFMFTVGLFQDQCTSTRMWVIRWEDSCGWHRNVFFKSEDLRRFVDGLKDRGIYEIYIEEI